ncbi:MAG TPA: PAS domain S-box protein [Bacteroidales bacterium]
MAADEYPKWRKACDYTLRNGSFSLVLKTKIAQQYFKLNLFAIKENGQTLGITIYGSKITEFNKPQEFQKELLKFVDKQFIVPYHSDHDERYRYIVENAPLSIYQLTIDGKFTFCNSAILKHYECADFNEFYQKYGDFEKCIVNKTTLETYKSLIARNGFVNGFEMEVKLENDKNKWFSYYAYINESKTLINGFSLDITERKQAEKAAIESQFRYKMLYESMIDAYVAFDNEGKIIEFNKTFASMLGYSSEELYKLTYYDITPLSCIEKDQKIYIEQVLVRGYSDIYEKNYKRKNGEVFPVELRTNLLKDGEGNIVGKWAIIRDITERKKTELILKASEERLQQLLNTVTDYIYSVTIDNAGNINTIHGEGCKTVTGYSQEEFISDQYLWFNIIHEEDRDAVINQAKILMQNIEPSSIEHRIIHKSGIIKWVRNTPVIRRNEQGEMIGYDGLIADITDRKMAEIALKETERKILNATIEAEEKERAHIARELHDGIGPLLSTIKLYIEWLNKPELQTPKEEIVNNANKTVAETISAIKEISQKLSPYIVTNFGLEHGLKEYIDKLKESCNIVINYESNLKIRLSSEIEVTLYRIILECINNTIKYAEAKKIYIRLNVFEQQLFVDYEDDGKGFDYSTLKSDGNGQGLINIKNRIASMGGKITIESRPGHGFKMKVITNI